MFVIIGKNKYLLTPIPYFIINLLMTPMFSFFALAIKRDCSFLTIFQGFHLFVSFIFDKLAPPSLNICFKRCFKLLFSPLQCIKQSQKCQKHSVFSISAFWSTCQWGGGGGGKPEAIAPPGNATGCAHIRLPYSALLA